MYWPVALVAIGLLQIAQARTSGGVVGGGIWIFVGSVMLANRLGLLRLGIWDLWPLILVLVGVRIVWQAYAGDARDPRDVDSGSRTSGLAVMGGFNRRITSHEFRGADLTAFS